MYSAPRPRECVSELPAVPTNAKSPANSVRGGGGGGGGGAGGTASCASAPAGPMNNAPAKSINPTKRRAINVSNATHSSDYVCQPQRHPLNGEPSRWRSCRSHLFPPGDDRP